MRNMHRQTLDRITKLVDRSHARHSAAYRLTHMPARTDPNNGAGT
jgi:hypothetical protein